MTSTPVDVRVPPSGAGCAACLPDPAGWWFHLQRCAECGQVGCCDSSPSQHSSRHAAESGHPIIAPPTSHPTEQPTRGPDGRVPADAQSRLH